MIIFMKKVTIYIIVTILFCLVAPSIADQTAKDKVLSIEVSSIASNAYHVVTGMPSVGLEGSVAQIEALIDIQSELLKGTNMLNHQLAIVLKEMIANAMMNEWYRMIKSTTATNTSRPVFDEIIFRKLWDSNLPNEEVLMKKCFGGKGDITTYLKNKGIENVLYGDAVEELLDNSYDNFGEIEQSITMFIIDRNRATADEIIVQKLILIQRLRDLDLIIRAYYEHHNSEDDINIESLVEKEIKNAHPIRLDDGMPQSSFMTSDSLSGCCFRYRDEINSRCALLLGPFMKEKERESLPELVQEYLTHIQESHDREAKKTPQEHLSSELDKQQLPVNEADE